MYQYALYKAIRYFGSQEALARAIGVKQQSISNWLNREHSIPYKQVLKISSATKGQVSYHELAPEEKSLNKIVDDFIKL
jgi:DNA-binding transcriptional regulator YdaS (Cro superfamily)